MIFMLQKILSVFKISRNYGLKLQKSYESSLISFVNMAPGL